MFAKKSVGEVADHYEEVIRALDKKPAIIGHSFGGLLTEILAGRGLAAASVPISPAPFRGVLPLPYAALRTASVALRNPANRNRAVPLTYDQFKYSFANMLDDDEAKELYEKYSVAGPGKVLFQAANANLNPWTEVKVDTKNPERGPDAGPRGRRRTTRSRTRSPTRRSSARSTTRASPRCSSSRAAATRCASITAGATSATRRSSSSSGSPRWRAWLRSGARRASPSRARAGRWVLAVAVLGSGMAFLDGTIVNVALPDIGRDLDASTSALQWILNGYLLALASLILLGGSLGDRYGRRRVFVIGVALFTVASLLCAMAPSAEMLIAARFLQGVGGRAARARQPGDDRGELPPRATARGRSAPGRA